MRSVLEDATLPPLSLHKALALNGVTVIIAFMHGKIHFLRYLEGLREKKENQHCNSQEEDVKYLPVSAPNTSITKPQYKYSFF